MELRHGHRQRGRFGVDAEPPPPGRRRPRHRRPGDSFPPLGVRKQLRVRNDGIGACLHGSSTSRVRGGEVRRVSPGYRTRIYDVQEAVGVRCRRSPVSGQSGDASERGTQVKSYRPPPTEALSNGATHRVVSKHEHIHSRDREPNESTRPSRTPEEPKGTHSVPPSPLHAELHGRAPKGLQPIKIVGAPGPTYEEKHPLGPSQKPRRRDAYIDKRGPYKRSCTRTILRHFRVQPRAHPGSPVPTSQFSPLIGLKHRRTRL